MRKLKAITVHGTFDPGASWDDLDSPMVRGVTDTLAGRDVEISFEQFVWSGRNEHEARREAAEALTRRLDELVEEPTDGLFVIGHSHGGTVARLALNSMKGEKRPTGVFTFGSPFVRFRPRPVRGVMTSMLWLFRALMAAILLGVLLMTLAGAIDNNAGAFAPYLAGAAMLVILVIAYFIDRAIRSARNRLVEIRDDLVQRFDPPEAQSVGYVCYHAVGDEAGLLLRFWGVFTWVLQTLIFTFLYGALAMLVMAFSAIGLGLLKLADIHIWNLLMRPVVGPTIRFFLADGPVSTELIENVTGWLPVSLTPVAFIALLFLLLAALAAAPFSLLLPWLLRSQWFAFGGEKFSWSFATDINVDRLPNRALQISVCFLPVAWLKRSLQHNYYYNHPAIIADIAAKMAEWKVTPKRSYRELEQVFSRALRFVALAAIIFGVYLTAVTIPYETLKPKAATEATTQ